MPYSTRLNRYAFVNRVVIASEIYGLPDLVNLLLRTTTKQAPISLKGNLAIRNQSNRMSVHPLKTGDCLALGDAPAISIVLEARSSLCYVDDAVDSRGRIPTIEASTSKSMPTFTHRRKPAATS
jgi:hypothetical protein